MRRADRLFQIVQLLRGKSVVTAAAIAEHLEVSLRTIYRDMDDLSASGVPIRAEAGVGYALEKGFDLPPLMFTRDELEALIAGARLVGGWGDAALKKASAAALEKIEQVLPHTLRSRADLALFAPDFLSNDRLWEPMADLRRALREKRKFSLSYTTEAGKQSTRVLRPLGLYYWGRVWTLVAWCELRDDFRHFRIDRMRDWQVLPDSFVTEAGKTLEEYIARVCAEARDWDNEKNHEHN